MTRILVTGAGGFIGHHLVADLKRQGHWVRGVDIKRPEYSGSAADDFQLLDLREPANARAATEGVEHVYALAADMGGMGYISAHHGLILHNNSLINLNTLEAARVNGVSRYLYSSSACVYPEYKQTEAAVTALKEDDAYPAQPQDAYGWEKLVTERLCTHYREDYGIATRVARYHNVYGPEGTYDGGREKAPAAICRKVIAAKLSGKHEIEIWGDGEQTRSFMYIDDCTDGTIRLAASDIIEPLNIGSDELVSINRLVDIVEKIAGVKLRRSYKLDAPKGVRGRNSDNTLINKLMNWAPSVRLEDGMEKTYKWIHDEMTSGKVSVVNALPKQALAAQ